MTEIHPGGIFEAEIADAELPLKYKLKVDYGSGGKFTIVGPVRASCRRSASWTCT